MVLFCVSALASACLPSFLLCRPLKVSTMLSCQLYTTCVIPTTPASFIVYTLRRVYVVPNMKSSPVYIMGKPSVPIMYNGHNSAHYGHFDIMGTVFLLFSAVNRSCPLYIMGSCPLWRKLFLNTRGGGPFRHNGQLPSLTKLVS